MSAASEFCESLVFTMSEDEFNTACLDLWMWQTKGVLPNGLTNDKYIKYVDTKDTRNPHFSLLGMRDACYKRLLVERGLLRVVSLPI